MRDAIRRENYAPCRDASTFEDVQWEKLGDAGMLEDYWEHEMDVLAELRAFALSVLQMEFHILQQSVLMQWWRKLSPRDFVVMFESLETTGQQVKLLRCLTVPVTMTTTPKACKMSPMYLMALHDTPPQRSENFFQLELCSSKSRRGAYEVEYVGAIQLVNPAVTVSQKAYILKALLDADDPAVFETVLGSWISHAAWTDSSVKTSFYFDMIIDVVLLGLVLWCCMWSRRSRTPGHGVFVALGLCAGAVVLRLLGVLFGMVCLFGVGTGIRKFCSTWNINQALSAIITGIWVFNACIHVQPASECQGHVCWFKQHEASFMVVVALRCYAIVERLLAMGSMGLAVLPAYRAMLCSETLYFAGFMGLMWLLAMLSYYTFPLQVDDVSVSDEFTFPKEWKWADLHFLLELCLKVYRFVFLGDFDMGDLEELNPEIYGTMGQNYTAVVRGGDKSPYHMGIQLWFLVFSCMIHISAMNVFIGVLSNKYTEFCECRHGLHEEFRGAFIFQRLLVEVALERLGLRLRAAAQPHVVQYWEEGGLLYYDATRSGSSGGQGADEAERLKSEVQRLQVLLQAKQADSLMP